ncbi:unnamed protein product [Caenorhabditis nigoni]
MLFQCFPIKLKSKTSVPSYSLCQNPSLPPFIFPFLTMYLLIASRYPSYPQMLSSQRVNCYIPLCHSLTP